MKDVSSVQSERSPSLGDQRTHVWLAVSGIPIFCNRVPTCSLIKSTRVGGCPVLTLAPRSITRVRSVEMRPSVAFETRNDHVISRKINANGFV